MPWLDFWDQKYTAALISSGVSALVSFLVSTKVSTTNKHHYLVSKICDRIENIIIDAIIYWKKPGNDTDAETRLKNQLQCIAHDMADFDKKHINKNNIEDKLRILSRDITSGDFESKKKKAEPNREQSITDSAHAVRDAIKLCKLK